MSSDDGPISFADLGIETRSPTVETVLGKVRICTSLNWKEIAFLAGSVVAILGVIGLTIERLTSVQKDSPDFTFAIILLINAVFCLYYVLSGIFFERPYELAALVLATGIVWIYLVLNYAVSKDRGPYKTSRLVVACVASPFLIGMGVYLGRSYYQSKNLIFRTVGALPDLQAMCDTMFVFFCLSIGDLQLSVTGAVLILSNGNKFDLEDKILLPIVLVVGLLSFALSYISVRLEKTRLLIGYAVLWVLMPAYAIYLIVKSGKTIDNAITTADKSIGGITIVAAVAVLIVRVLLAVVGFKVYNNFGKGLKQKVFGGEQDLNPSTNADEGTPTA